MGQNLDFFPLAFYSGGMLQKKTNKQTNKQTTKKKKKKEGNETSFVASLLSSTLLRFCFREFFLCGMQCCNAHG